MTEPSDLRQLVYEENIRAPTWLILLLGLFLGGAAGLISAFAIRSLTGNPIVEGSEAVILYAFLTAYLLLDLFLMVNFTNLAVSVSRETIELRFGVFSKRLPLANVSRAEPRDYAWAKYGGWGLRMVFGGRRAWSMIGVPKGVVVSFYEDDNSGTYFISSRTPETLADAINGVRSTD